jgi:thioredoxin reductase (NADPH)
LTQLQPFAVPMHLGHQVKSLTRLPTNHWQITTNQGLCLDSQVVIIAAGVGAFQPKTLNTAGISDLLAQGRWAYHPPSPLAQRDPCAYGGQHIWVLGSEEDAIDDVLALASLPPPQQPASITLLHRRSVLNAPPSKLEALSALIASERVLFCVGQIIDVDDHHVMIESPEGHQFSLPFDAGRAFLGLSPKLGPISQWGLAMTQKQLQVDPATMSTSETGIFAVGDVNTYLGKKKLLVCGFHEAVMAAFAASTLIRSHPPVLEYTSSSSRLRALLTQ